MVRPNIKTLITHQTVAGTRRENLVTHSALFGTQIYIFTCHKLPLLPGGDISGRYFCFTCSRSCGAGRAGLIPSFCLWDTTHICKQFKRNIAQRNSDGFTGGSQTDLECTSFPCLDRPVALQALTLFMLKLIAIHVESHGWKKKQATTGCEGAAVKDINNRQIRNPQV